MTTPSGSEGSLAETETALVIASEDLLSQDAIPDENQQVNCFSCGEPMVGLFCHACGQKNDDYRRSIFSLATETFSSIFSLENRMWRTWILLLLKPGKVAREYADGKRTNWTSPVRIYLALSIVLFGYMGLTETRIFSIRTDIVPKAGFEHPIEDLSDTSVTLTPDFGFFRRQATIDQLNSNVDFERITRLMQGVPKQAFIYDGNLETLGISPTDEILVSSGSWPDNSSALDTSETTESEARTEALQTFREKVETSLESYNIILSNTQAPDTIIDRLLEAEVNGSTLNVIDELNLPDDYGQRMSGIEAIQTLDEDLAQLGLTRPSFHRLPIEIRKGFNIGVVETNGVRLTQSDIQTAIDTILKNPAVLNEGISKYLPRIMFLMMPFAAIIGMIFIRGKETALLYDHLVHATYIHAVTFAFLLSLILIAQWSSLPDLFGIFFLGVGIYLPISAKRMFGRGWVKSIFASYSIAFAYGMVMFLVLTLLTANSVMDAIQLARA